MNALLHGLRHRVLSAAIALVPTADAWFSYANDHDQLRLLSILGWVILGVAWFLRPAVFARSFQEGNRRSAELAVLTQMQWSTVVAIGLSVLLVGLVARLLSAA